MDGEIGIWIRDSKPGIFGAGKLNQIGVLASEFGSRALAVHGMGLNRISPLLDKLQDVDLEWTDFSIRQEPTIEHILKETQLALSENG